MKSFCGKGIRLEKGTGMGEKRQILYMQARMLRQAAEKWDISMEDVTKIFVKYGVLQYIEECYGIFHVQGDEAILEDIGQYLKNRGIESDTEVRG